MKNILVLLLFSFFCLLVAASSFTKPSLEKCLYPVVLVESIKSKSTGTGFIVKSKKVNNKYVNICLSCSHILDSNDITISTSDYKKPFSFKSFQKYNGLVISKDEKFDISLISFLSDNKYNEVEIDMEYKPELRDSVFTIAHGMADPARYSEGIVSSVDDDKKEISTSVGMLLGDSGGPLFHQNKVVGIANAMKAYKIGKLTIPLNNFSIYKHISGSKKLLEQSKLYDLIINSVETDLSELEKKLQKVN